MRDVKQQATAIDRLPRESVHRLTEPLARFLRVEAAGGTILLACIVLALALSNSSWGPAYLAAWETPLGLRLGSLEFVRSLREWINDALMTLFFLLVAVELKRELVLGELRAPRTAMLSIAAALGGMIVPACLYLLLQAGRHAQMGWGTVMATDTALVIGCLALLGTRIPHALRLFMLSLAIVDDIGSILVVAVGYSAHVAWQALALAAFAVAALRLMTVVGIRSVPAYFLVGGLAWIAFDASGIPATITGVVIGLMTPTGRWVSDQRLYAILGRVVAHPSDSGGSGKTRDRETLQAAEVAARETLSPAERLQIALHPWVGFLVMPLFALANAGLPLSMADPGDSVVLAVIVGFVIGKPVGIMTFSWLAVRTGIAIRPPELSWGLLAGGGLLAGIGFTMALFIANLAFADDLLHSVKLGVLGASAVSAVGGLTLLTWLTRRGRHLAAAPT